MIMIEKNEIIKTSDGNMDTFVVHPDGGGKFSLVVFLMDAPGKREELHDMARRIASSGYYVLLPDLYYRFEPGFVTDFTEESRKIMFSYMHSLTYNMIIRDFESLLNYAENDSFSDHSLVGTVGYCMSGPFVFRLAAEFTDVIKCAASIHGVSLLTKDIDSPHLFAKKIKGEIYFAYAENDSYAPTQMITDLNNYLKNLKINYNIEIYPGTGHGFVFPQRKGMYNKNASEKHWDKLIDLFSRNLS